MVLKEKSLKRIRASLRGGHALFLEVMVEKADQRCSTSLLPQCGHKTSASSQSVSDKILENNLLQLWQKNS